MLSKLGVKTKLDGNWLNRTNADKIFNILKSSDIDESRPTVKEHYGTEEIVITDRESRTVFGNYASFHSGERQWNFPQEVDIRDAAIIALDPYLKEESLNVAQMCVRNKKPYVTIDCTYDDFMARHGEALIISHELRDKAYRDAPMVDVFEGYQRNCEGLIIFTFGGDELWYGRRGQSMKKQKPYRITPVDTTGAGDSFRSGIIYGLLNSWDDESTVEFASAVAACVCLTIPHTLNAPDKDGIIRFMQDNKRKYFGCL